MKAGKLTVLGLLVCAGVEERGEMSCVGRCDQGMEVSGTIRLVKSSMV
jgi:hypothetical protein